MVEIFLIHEFRGTTSCVARHVCGLDDQVGADNLGISSDSGWSRATFTTAAARPDRRFYRASHLAPRTLHNILPQTIVLKYAKRAAAVSILLGILPYHS